MRVTVIGANGFVGSAFVRLLSRLQEVELISVTRSNYAASIGRKSDLVIEAACNSKKYIADKEPAADFQASVTHRLQTLLDFPADFHLHISSVDVYCDLTSPATTREDATIGLEKPSNYGFHKLLAEQLVRHYARRWLIVRLAGMVGPNLRKNPVFDILHSWPIFIHPDSRYQFLHTANVAQIVWDLYRSGKNAETFNLAGQGLISPREIAKIAGRELDLSQLTPPPPPRVVDINLGKIAPLVTIPNSSDTIAEFVKEWRNQPGQ